MAKSSPKSTAAMERLLEERRQYEAWLARLDAARDTTPDHVRVRVRADYQARLQAVTEELRGHAEQARQLIVQKRERLTQLARKEKELADQLKETELRHAVGEFDEAEWVKVHRDAQAGLLEVREELRSVQGDIAKLEDLDQIVRGKQPATGRNDARGGGGGGGGGGGNDRKKAAPVDELAFLKSVTEDEQAGPSPRRASGALFQPVTPDMLPSLPPSQEDGPGMDGEKTLKCRACGTLNLPTEWYCEQCGAELAAV
jgi:hypothetical protein